MRRVADIVALLRRVVHSPLHRVKKCFKSCLKEVISFSIYKRVKPLPVFSINHVCAELIGFTLIPNLHITVHRLLNINSPNSPVIGAPLPLRNWWLTYNNFYLEMRSLVILSTTSNIFFFNSKCCRVSGSILTSTNWDITSSLGTKCFWWNNHTIIMKLNFSKTSLYFHGESFRCTYLDTSTLRLSHFSPQIKQHFELTRKVLMVWKMYPACARKR